MHYSAIHPGHPVVIAFIITKVFPNYDAAAEKWPYGTAAHTSLLVPGCSGSVSEALRLLQRLRNGADFDAVVADADASWALQKDSGYPHMDEEARQKVRQNWEAGQEEAERYKGPLKAQMEWWG